MLAAQYVRMSTDHQQYSIDNQEAKIAEYAAANGFSIIKTYADHARSGLDLAGRPALMSLLNDVTTATRDLDAILVYDVSRWGRFQDVDESAYYEFICKRAGVRVHYCAELFKNDDSIAAVLLKTLKRTMAGEYLRELSVKVLAGQCRIARAGYSLGAQPGYGLRRLLVGADGRAKMILRPGEWKNITTERVTFCVGPEDELRVIRTIYSMFIDNKMNPCEIARSLNSRGLKRTETREWDDQAIRQILFHPKYAGCLTFNKTSRRLGSKVMRNPSDQWIVVPNSFPAIVTTDRFNEAQEQRRRLTCHKSDDQLLADLVAAKDRHGRLSERIINNDRLIPSVSVYQRRLGGLKRAYELVGYHPAKSIQWIGERNARHQIRVSAEIGLVNALTTSGMVLESQGRIHKITGYGLLVVQVARSQPRKAGGHRWAFRASQRYSNASWLIVRMAACNKRIVDYVLFDIIPVPPCALAWPDQYFLERGVICKTLDIVVDHIRLLGHHPSL